MVVAATPLENHCSIIVNNEVAVSVPFRCTLGELEMFYSGNQLVMALVLLDDATFVYIIILPKHHHQGPEDDGLSRDRVIFLLRQKNTCSFLE